MSSFRTRIQARRPRAGLAAELLRVLAHLGRECALHIAERLHAWDSNKRAHALFFFEAATPTKEQDWLGSARLGSARPPARSRAQTHLSMFAEVSSENHECSGNEIRNSVPNTHLCQDLGYHENAAQR